MAHSMAPMAPEYSFEFTLTGLRGEHQADAMASHAAEVLAAALDRDVEVSYWPVESDDDA